MHTALATAAGADSKDPETIIQAEKRGSPVVNFQDPSELSVIANPASSRSLTVMVSADFDSDGIIDLVTADRTGTLRFYRGNADSIFPNHPQAKKHKAEGKFLDSPFHPSEKSFSFNTAPDFLRAGDFNADGKKDILALTKGDDRLQLMRGDGRGNFSEPVTVQFDGKATALIVGQIGRPDGQTDVAVAVQTDKGSQLLVFEHPEGAFKRKPESFELPAPATSISLGRLDEDPLFDIAVACGEQLVFIHGHQQIYPWEMMPEAGLARPPAEVGKRTLPFRVSELTTGKFTAGRGDSIAMLAEDGSLHLLEPPPPKKQENAKPLAPVDSLRSVNTPTGEGFEVYKRLKRVQLTAEEWTRRGYKPVDRTGRSRENSNPPMNATENPNEKPPKTGPTLAPSSYTAPSRIEEWRESVWLAGSRLGAAAQSGKSSLLTTARVSDSPFDDLLVLDESTRQIHVVGSPDSASETQSAILASLDVEGGPTALLPVRLNVDALSDLVVLRNGASVPTVILSAPANTYTVNTVDDVASNCQPAEPCTLRAAIMAANSNPGADLIAFNIPGEGVHTIAPATELPIIGDAVTIDATTQPGYAGTPVIEITGSDLSPDSGVDGLKVRASD
ncbi:MAG TPA: FG-GAP-like repeat-containing protein, partial [Blastocatellia bacterium]|nr:FG-GAP-like repeat-containing protein [Blastocatellia bacterium]